MACHSLWGNIAIDVRPRWLGNGIFQMGTLWFGRKHSWGLRQLPTGWGRRAKRRFWAAALPSLPSSLITALRRLCRGLRLQHEKGLWKDRWALGSLLRAKGRRPGSQGSLDKAACPLTACPPSTGPFTRARSRRGEAVGPEKA